MRTSCKEMISRALGPCSHGWVDECASPPHLVTRPLLQSPADVLKTQQSVLTVFPRVRPHPIVLHCFHGDQEVTASLSEFHLTCRSAAQHTGKQDESIFGNNLNITPLNRVCHQRLSGFAIYLTFSIIGYSSQRRRHRSQKAIHSGPNKWIFTGSSICIPLSLGSINPPR